MQFKFLLLMNILISSSVLVLVLICVTVSKVAIAQKIHHPHIAQLSKLTDTLIVPGERVGLVTQKTSKQDLIKFFGVSHLVDKTISGAEGEGRYPATQINLSQGRSLLVIWSDPTQTKPVVIKILGSAWKTPEDIGIGTPLSKLRQKLGKTFQLYGLDWDYGGTILLKSSRLSRYQGKLILQVGIPSDAAIRFPQDYNAVVGDRTFSADNPHWKPLGVKITEISVLF